jgi:FkbM family methyltransferase
MANSHPGGLTRDHVVWAYRLLLDRDPESEDVIGPKLAGSRDTAELRRHLMTSAEFQDKNRDYAHTNERTIVIREIAPGLRLFVDLSDHVIGLAIVRGRYEREEIAFVRGLLRPGDVAVDAGAHIGVFTMHMADAVGPAGHVHAFEPLPANADLLAQSIAENRFEARVTLLRAAVGDAAGEATLAFPAETLNTGGAYLLRAGGAPLGGHHTAAIPVQPLDGAALRRPVRFIKMDVEGAEPRVLAGARRLLAEDRPTILSELHPEQLQRASGVTADAFLAQLAALGYRAHRLEHGAIGARLERAPADAVTSIVLVPG